MTNPIRVVVTGAAGQIGYSILQPLALGLAFGPNQPIHLVLFDLAVVENKMKGIVVELEDLASPVLAGTTIATTGDVAFKDADYIICLAGRMALGMQMTRAMLAESNKPIYEEHGKLINAHAKKTCKVLVIGNPCNTMCLVLLRNCPSIPKENFTSLSRLDHNRMIYMLAKKLGISAAAVHNVCVWGNHSSSMVPDVTHTTAIVNGKTDKIVNLIKDSEFWKEFPPQIQERAMKVVEYRGATSALSSAIAGVHHLHDWHCGTPDGQYSSMGVYSNGEYDAPKDVFFSFPCVCKNGKWEIVKGLTIDDEIKGKLEITGKDLVNEKELLGL